jgi:hypothetical protein
LNFLWKDLFLRIHRENSIMKNLIFVTAAIGLSLISCDQRPNANFEGGNPEREYNLIEPAPTKAQARIVRIDKSEIIQRKLIKNGEITFSTKNIDETRKELEKACKEFDGYVSSEEQQKFDESINYKEVIRIPAGRFDAFMKVIEKLGEHIEYRNFTTQDVTEEFIDTEARLKTKKELETRYHQLLGKATKVTDMLAIEEQISKVRTEIETMQGRLNFLTNQVGYSTLTVNYHQVIAGEFGFGSRLISSFVTGWNGLLAFLIGIISAWPFFLILGGSFWLITRWVKRINFNYFNKSRQPSGEAH